MGATNPARQQKQQGKRFYKQAHKHKECFTLAKNFNTPKKMSSTANLFPDITGTANERLAMIEQLKRETDVLYQHPSAQYRVTRHYIQDLIKWINDPEDETIERDYYQNPGNTGLTSALTIEIYYMEKPPMSGFREVGQTQGKPIGCEKALEAARHLLAYLNNLGQS